MYRNIIIHMKKCCNYYDVRYNMLIVISQTTTAAWLRPVFPHAVWRPAPATWIDSSVHVSGTTSGRAWITNGLIQRFSRCSIGIESARGNSISVSATSISVCITSPCLRSLPGDGAVSARCDQHAAFACFIDGVLIHRVVTVIVTKTCFSGR
jgi:hypothetical protein